MKTVLTDCSRPKLIMTNEPDMLALSPASSGKHLDADVRPVHRFQQPAGLAVLDLITADRGQ